MSSAPHRSTARRWSPATVLAVIAIIGSIAFSAFTWIYAKRHPVKEIVYVDKWGTTRGRVISATVTTFQSQNKLVVKELTGHVRVKATKTLWVILKGTQEIIIPASVTYSVDLSSVKSADVSFDPYGKMLFVRLPPVRISEVSLDMTHARQVDGGILTMNNEVRQELNKINYRNANSAFLALASDRSRLDAARMQAQKNVTSLLELPLKATGNGGITVRAY